MSTEVNGLIQFLIDRNCELIEELLNALATISELDYQATRAGAHVRHILEFYSCLLEQSRDGRVDYDKRIREQALEQDRDLARTSLVRVSEALREIENGDFEVMVAAEDSAKSEISARWTKSSLSRELDSLQSHTMHHCAVIRLLLPKSVKLPESFGVAYATRAATS